MRLIQNRPLIEADDFPLTVFNAFREPNWYDSLYDGDKSHLHHRSHNAWETVEDGFAMDRFNGTLYRPDGQALILDFGIDYLEFALVYYGCRLLSESPDETGSEVEHVDELLRRVDIAKGLSQVVESQ